MNFTLKLSDVLNAIEDTYQVYGNEDVSIAGFASLENAIQGDLSFVQARKYFAAAAQTNASVLLLPEMGSEEGIPLPDGVTTIVVKNPSRAFSQVCGRVESLLFPVNPAGIHAHAIVDETVQLGEGVSIGPFSTIEEQSDIASGVCIGARTSIGKGCRIGRHVRIADNVVIGPYTTIGEGCIIHPGVVIGTPGFGYEFNLDTGCHDPIPQVGRVVIGNYVDIGANTTIDRARMGATIIGDGTKIDNLVQVGHNARIGKHCILCALVGVSGSVNIGNYVVMGGQAGVADHVEIADGVQIAGGSGVMNSLLVAKAKVAGTPATDFGLAMKTMVLQKKLPDLFKRMGTVEKQLNEQ